MNYPVLVHGRTQLVNYSSQIGAVEIHLFNMIAQSKVFKESIDALFAAAVEDRAPQNAKPFETCALLREMAQPAELLAATKNIIFVIIG